MPGVEQFRLPDLGEGLAEGVILRWLVAVGDTVVLNQPIVEVETAKAAVEIPAMWAGRVRSIFHGEGETVAVGSPIIAIETASRSGDDGVAGDDASGPDGASADGVRTPVLVGYGPPHATATGRRPRTAPAARRVPEAPSAPGAPGPVLAKPPVRRLARDLGVELRGMVGTGPQGSITREDVLAARDARGRSDDRVAHREHRVPVKGVRKLTAENMVASAFSAPHVTTFLTVDVTRSMRALGRLRSLPGWQDVRVSPLLLVAKAVLAAIRRHPMVNSTWDGDEIIVHEYVNLGIASATERGLIVPNIKDADRMSTLELAGAMGALVRTAREGRTTPAEMDGGTFTITNVGVFGIDTGTPILPPGQSAILALGSIKDSPWAHRGKLKIRQVTTLGLSFDHRVVDGELGSRFLSDVGTFLTDPATSTLAWG